MVGQRDTATSMEIYKALREFCEIPMGKCTSLREKPSGIRVALISRFISNQLPFISLAKNHVTIRDMDLILRGFCGAAGGPGGWGERPAGMILAYKISFPFCRNMIPIWKNTFGVPGYLVPELGSFLRFLDRNNLYLFHTFKYKDREEIEREFSMWRRSSNMPPSPPR